MSFLRCKSDSASAAQAGYITVTRRPRPTTIVPVLCIVSLFAGSGAAQNSHDFTASAVLTAKEISEYLVVRDARAIAVRANNPPNLAVNAIVQRMMKANALQSSELSGLDGKRWYHLQYRGLFGGRDASMEVLATYMAPDKRTFTVISESGSKLLLNRILLKLLESEQRALANKKKVQLTPANYKFELLGNEQSPDGSQCYILSVKARQPNEFLYNGKIWVNANDFAVVRMEGEPSKSPSFWIKDTEIQARWQKVGNFWFIAHDQSVSHIRMGGVATLTIDYGNYQITPADRRTAKVQAQGTDLPDPASVTPER